MGGQQDAGTTGGWARRAAEVGGEWIRRAGCPTVKVGREDYGGRKEVGHNANDLAQILWADQRRVTGNGAAGTTDCRAPVGGVRTTFAGSLHVNVAVVEPENGGTAGGVGMRAQDQRERAGAPPVRVDREAQLDGTAWTLPRLALQLNALPKLSEGGQSRRIACLY